MPQALRSDAVDGRVNAPIARWFHWRGTALLLALLAVGCASLGASDFPVFRSFGWFRFLDGRDIRQACGSAGDDRYRLVFNAVWGEQVRIYEITTGPGGANLATRVLFPENLNDVNLLDPLQLYRGKNATVALSADDIAEFRGRLRQSGYYEPAPDGLTLPSDGFYWVISSCEHGSAHFNAYVWPSPRFSAITFADWLLARDGTGVAVNSFHPPEPRTQNRVAVENRAYSVFDLRVGTDGLSGIP
jgi:hypothetical protein